MPSEFQKYQAKEQYTTPRTRRWLGWGSLAFILIVFAVLFYVLLTAAAH